MVSNALGTEVSKLTVSSENIKGFLEPLHWVTSNPSQFGLHLVKTPQVGSNDLETRRVQLGPI